MIPFLTEMRENAVINFLFDPPAELVAEVEAERYDGSQHRLPWLVFRADLHHANKLNCTNWKACTQKITQAKSYHTLPLAVKVGTDERGVFCGSKIFGIMGSGTLVPYTLNPKGDSESMNTWISFKELRANLDFAEVLRHYGIIIGRKGDQHLGFCPLPNHNGKKNSPSFSANLKRGIFHCFGCGAKGNVLEFAALMEKVSLDDGAAIHVVALELQQRFCPGLSEGRKAKPKADTMKQPQVEPTENLPVIINAPLDFDLKGLDPKHPYLLQRGFSPETIEHFGLGFCSRGYHKDRIAIPLHDHTGNLVGYGGRVVNDSTITKDNPRYLLPPKRERHGKVFEFRKTLFLYNGYRIKAPLDRLIVVESFTAVWWLFQNSLSNVVGTLGADCSDKQAELIVSLVKPEGQVWVLTDGDPAGERCATGILTRVAPHRLARWIKLKENVQPTDVSGEQLKTYFAV